MQVKNRKHIYLVYIKRNDFCTLEGLRLLCIRNDIRMNITIPCDMNDRKCLMMQKCIIGHFCVNGGRGSHLRNTKQILL